MSNGKYNCFRSKGYTRPWSTLQLCSEARNKYARMGLKTMRAMLTPKCKHNVNMSIENLAYNVPGYSNKVVTKLSHGCDNYVIRLSQLCDNCVTIL